MTDWILRGGEVIDGSGRPRRRADVAIAGDRIAAIGLVGRVEGAREMDVTGEIVYVTCAGSGFSGGWKSSQISAIVRGLYIFAGTFGAGRASPRTRGEPGSAAERPARRRSG